MERYLLLIPIAAFLVGRRLLLRHLIKKHNEQQRRQHSSYFEEYRGHDEARGKAIERWRAGGNSRKPRKTILRELENAPYDPEYMPAEVNEQTDLEEAFRGLEEDEISRILDEVLAEEK